MYLYQPTGSCLAAASLPDGYSADTTTMLAIPCTTVNCTDCRLTYTICYACNSSGAYPSFLLNNVCYMPKDMPVGYGADYLSYRAIPCVIGRCRNCSLNYTDCAESKFETLDFYLHVETSPNSCLTNTEMPDGYGPEKGLYTTRLCSVSNCIHCRECFDTCTSCDSNVVLYVYFHKGKCMVSSDLPNLYGANVVSKVATRCIDQNCISCKSDYSICEACST